MTDDDCRNIEKQAVNHLLRCTLDDNIWLKPLTEGFNELSKTMREL